MRALLLSSLAFAVLAGPPAAAQGLTAEGATPGQSVVIRSLTREANGDLMLRFTLVNDSCCGVSGVMLRENLNDASNKPSGVRLVDDATHAVYAPARGPDGQCVCSVMPNTGRGERANLWVRFLDVPTSLKVARIEVKTFEPVSVPITGP